VIRECMAGWAEEERKAVVVYPNSGEVWDGAEKVWMEGEGEEGAKGVEAWMQEWMGETHGERMIIGGCCRVEPEAIGRMRTWLDERYK